MHSNLYAVLREGFPTDTGAPFLVADVGHALSYGATDELSARYAGLLRQLGVAAGDRVVAQVGKSTAAIALYLGCLRAGAVYVPLNTAYTAREVEYFIGDARPRLLVCGPDAESGLRPIASRFGVDHVLSMEALHQQASGHPPDMSLASIAADGMVAMVYTSGTTGRSKGAMLTLQNLASNALTLHQLWGWRSDDVLLHALPVFHVHGLFVALHCAMLGGSPVLFHDRFDTARVRADLSKATVMMGVPTFYTRLLDDPDFGDDDCKNMRVFISGSAPLLPATFADFESRTGHRILERYGMTEAGMITSNPLHGERLPGTVGYPLPGVELRVVDDRGQSVAAGEVGGLEIRGPNVFAGYWDMPEKTAAEFTADGYFRTGDQGTQQADGRVSIVGRAKDLIISGGYNIYPKEIESCLDEHPSITESAVIGVPHPDFGEGVIAVIVPAGNPAVTDTELDSYLRERLARFKHPRRYLFVDELPRNAMGKVQKQRLRERYRNMLMAG